METRYGSCGASLSVPTVQKCNTLSRCGALHMRDRAAISDFLKAPMHNPQAKGVSALDDDDALAASCAPPLNM